MQRYIIIGQRRGFATTELHIVSSVDAYTAETRTMSNFIAYPWTRREEAKKALQEARWATAQEKTRLLRKLNAITKLDKS